MAVYSTISSNGGTQYGQDLGGQINSYTVQPGDTLSGIGQMFGVPWQSIYSANQNLIGGNPNLIQPGQVYNIPGQQNPANTGSLQNTLNGNQYTGGTPSNNTGGTPQNQGGSTQIQNPGNVDLSSQNQQFAYTPEQNRILANFDNYRTQLMGLSSMVDQNYNSELAQINAQMTNLKNDQARENDLYSAGLRQAGLASGMSMYTPEIMKGEIKNSIDQGIAKLGQLTTQQNGLITAARKANIETKINILKDLKDIDTEKYAVAQKMKEDFYTNIKLENDRIKTVVSENLPALYTQLRTLPDNERVAKLTQYAYQLGIPASKMMSYYQEYDKEENKQITEMRQSLMAQAPDIQWSYDDLYANPAEFSKKLMGSSLMKSKILGAMLDNQLKQATINKTIAETGALGTSAGGTFNSLPANIKNAAMVILGSTKMTKDQKTSFLSSLPNDPVVAKQVILNKARTELLSGNNQTDIENREQALKAMTTLDTKLKQYYANGGKSNLFKGSYEDVAFKLGTVSDPKLRSIAADISTALQAYRNSVSGTAFSVQEGREMASVFPSIKNGKILNDVLIKSRVNSLQNDIDSLYSSALGSDVYNQLKTSNLYNQAQADFMNMLLLGNQ